MVEQDKSTIDQFVLIKKIGEGGYGDAYKAYDVKTNDVVCVKIFHNHSKKFQEVWEAELEPGKRQFDHENILKVICAGQGNFFKNGKNKGCKLYIASEYGCNGQLFELLSSIGQLSPSMARTVFSQLLNAVEYVHNQGIVHRDIKLENFFLMHNLEVKLADFGLQKRIEGEGSQLLRTNLGTSIYKAPEIWNAGPGNPYEGKPVDVFALGCILFMILTTLIPFNQALDKDYRCYFKHPEHYLRKHNRTLEKESIDLISGMLRQDPKQRLTIPEIRAHEWLQQPHTPREEVLKLFKAQNQEACSETATHSI